MESKETSKSSTEPFGGKTQQSEMQTSDKLRMQSSGSLTERHQGPQSEPPKGVRSNILLPTFIEIV